MIIPKFCQVLAFVKIGIFLVCIAPSALAAVSYQQNLVNATGGGTSHGSATYVVAGGGGTSAHAFFFQQQSGPCVSTDPSVGYAFFLGGNLSNYFYAQNCDGPWSGDGQYHWTMYDFVANSPCGSVNGPCNTFSLGDWANFHFYISNWGGGAYIDPSGNLNPALVLQDEVTLPPDPRGLPITVSEADSFVLQDTTTVWNGGAGATPAFGPLTLSPAIMSYQAPSSFEISRVHVGSNVDGSLNNHDGVGNVRAWIFDLNGNPVASSTSRCYAEGGCSGADLLFALGTVVPQAFVLSFITDDGAQGDSGFNLSNISVFAEKPHPSAVNLSQFGPDGVTALPEGGTTSGSQIVLKSTLQSSSTDPLILQIEVQPFGTPFMNIVGTASSPVTAGQTAIVTIPGLLPGSYHWQARTVDLVSLISTSWQEFGAIGNIDFAIGTVVVIPGPPIPPASNGIPSPQQRPVATTSEPIDTSSGNYYYQHVDASVPGNSLPVVFERTYNSLDNYVGPLGPNWTHSFNVILSSDITGQVTIRWGDGHGETFIPSAAGYSPQFQAFGTLNRNADGTFVLVRRTQIRYQFSATGKLMSIRDRNGNTVSLAYDPSGSLGQITDAVGRNFTLSYDASRRISQISDPIGRVTTYGYGNAGDLEKITDAAGGLTQFAYDANHRVLSVTLPNDVVLLQNAYDAQGRVIAQTNGRGFTTNLSYDSPAPGQTTIIDPRGNKTIHTYDSLHRIARITDPMGGSVSFTYDASNNRNSITNQNGKTTNMSYDSFGNVVGISDALANSSAFSYDTANNLLSATNPKGNSTSFSYDANGNAARIQDALGNSTYFSYDGSGKLTSKTDARGNSTAFAYDMFGNLSGITDALGNQTSLSYDGAGRLTTITDPNGHAASASYDALDHLLSVVDSLGNKSQFVFDSVGNLVENTDPNGNSTNYTYDATNNLVAVTDALGHITRYTYDPGNNRTGFTNAKGYITTYAYDATNRLASVTDPLAFVTSYSYDPIGNILATTDPKGQTNRFTYDALNRLLGISYADGKSVAYSFDADGNRATMADSHGTTVYGYDALDRVVSVTHPGNKVVGYSYDAVGNRATLAYPDGKMMSYGYDSANRLGQVTDWIARTTTYAYDAANNLKGIAYPNRAGISFSYDPANRLTKVVNSSAGVPLFSFGYSLDAAGNRTGLSVNGVLTKFSYDPLNQLTSAQAGSLKSNWTYDVAGNRIQQVLSTGTTRFFYDAADRLLSAGSASFGYDANGNRVSARKTQTASPIAFRYDAANRLVAVTGGPAISAFAYDGDGNRVSQSIGTATYAYTNDVAASLPVVLAETGPDGTISYGYGLNLLEASGSNFNYFYHYDGLGSVVALTGITGVPEAAYVYDAWGNTLAAVTDSAGVKNKFRFTGEPLDPGTGLYFLRARYYDPSIGQFPTRDPVAGLAFQPQTFSRYLYSFSNPMRYADHSGLSPLESGKLGQSAANPQSTALVSENLGSIFQSFLKLACSAGLPLCSTAISTYQVGQSTATAEANLSQQLQPTVASCVGQQGGGLTGQVGVVSSAEARRCVVGMLNIEGVPPSVTQMELQKMIVDESQRQHFKLMP
jgi:RHS repeat-associated protein